MNVRRFVITSVLCICCMTAAAGKDLRGDIEKVIAGRQATIGVAVMCGDTVITVNNSRKYPLMSVFKLHVAVTALRKMDAEGIPLDSTVLIRSEQLHENTYSPLRNRYPGQDIRISYRDIVGYTVSHSDNNTCDLLIGFAGGIDKVDSCIKSLGITDLNLTETEADMHEDIRNGYLNWSTPMSVVRLFEKIYSGEILSTEHSAFLERILLECSSGQDKLKAGLPGDVPVAHKTGHSDRLPDGTMIGDADAGVIYMPDGRKCYVSVLIMDSKETDEVNAGVMAEIAGIVYRYFKI